MRNIFAFLLLSVAAWAADSGDLDSLFAGKEYSIELSASLRDASDDEVSMAMKAAPAKNTAVAKTDTVKVERIYALQFAAIAEFDDAQAKSAEIRRKTGLPMKVYFDAPFYKVRGGKFPERADAEAAAKKFASRGLNSIIVKIK